MTTAAEKKTEDWMTSKWRPLMAITYMATIWYDFMLGPILFNLMQFYGNDQTLTSWTPLTLQGGGLYHLSMGAILGIAAWTRGKEKIAMIENTPTPTDTSWANNSRVSYNEPPESQAAAEYSYDPDTDPDRPRRRKI